jgi:hypothetical protein
VVESPAISTVDVMRTTGGAGTTAASEADKAGTIAHPAAEGEGGVVGKAAAFAHEQ